MQWAELYQKETEKPLGQFVKDLNSAGKEPGFIIQVQSAAWYVKITDRIFGEATN